MTTWGGEDFGSRKISHPAKRLKTPAWMYNNKEIENFLLHQFPYMVDDQRTKSNDPDNEDDDNQDEVYESTAYSDQEYSGIAIPKEIKSHQRQRKRCERQRKMAGRWAFVIKNFFTGGMSSRDIEVEWNHGSKCKCATRLIQRI